MQTKLTLRLDDELIRRAKAWARARGLSLSEAVGAVFAQLPEDTGEAPLRVGPWMRQLIGAAGPRRRRRQRRGDPPGAPGPPGAEIRVMNSWTLVQGLVPGATRVPGRCPALGVRVRVRDLGGAQPVDAPPFGRMTTALAAPEDAAA